MLIVHKVYRVLYRMGDNLFLYNISELQGQLGY